LKSKNSVFQLLLWGILIFVLIGISVVFFLKNQGSKVSTHSAHFYGEVPDFALVEKNGYPITKADLLGNNWIADLIFTRCQGQCPFMTQKMIELRKRVPKNEKLKWVSISVDPSWDTPQVLSEYAKKYHADFDDWLFLTGDKEKVFSLIRKGFRLGLEEEGGSVAEPIIHSNRFILVDREGKICGMYPATDEEALQKLQQDVMKLLKEKS
jgi:protein SCO1/2